MRGWIVVAHAASEVKGCGLEGGGWVFATSRRQSPGCTEVAAHKRAISGMPPPAPAPGHDAMAVAVEFAWLAAPRGAREPHGVSESVGGVPAGPGEQDRTSSNAARSLRFLQNSTPNQVAATHVIDNRAIWAATAGLPQSTARTPNRLGPPSHPGRLSDP